jgi:Protein of unknown function (DUF4043)
MSTTITPTTLEGIDYQRKFMTEYVRESGFSGDMGTTPQSIIQVKNMPAVGGTGVKFGLLDALPGAGTYVGKLNGNEQQIGKLAFTVNVKFRRHAVELDKEQEYRAFAKVESECRPLLKDWSAVTLRSNMIDSLCSVKSSNGIVKTFLPVPVTLPQTVGGSYASVVTATSAENNQWLTDNASRVVFGAAASNQVPGNFAASLATLDYASDTLSLRMLQRMRTLARVQKSQFNMPMIRPIKIEGQAREWFKVYCGPRGFDSLKQDALLQKIDIEARSREGSGMDKNPIFQSGDRLYDGIIITEIPEFAAIPGAGTGGNDVEPVIMCGGGAVCLNWGQMPKFVAKKETDYDFFTGIGIEECLGYAKLQRDYTSGGIVALAGKVIDNGMVTGFVAAPPLG